MEMPRVGHPPFPGLKRDLGHPGDSELGHPTGTALFANIALIPRIA